MKRKNLIKGFLYLGIVSFGVSCTNLDEEVLDGQSYISSGGATNINATAVLQSAYNGLRDFNGQGMMYALDEMSTDAMVGPTRGGDWDDNGVWRQIHTQTWAPDHNEVKGAWNSLLSNVYNCNLVIESGTATASQVLQARFLRAFYYYNVVDLFGQAPYRPAGSNLLDDPKVWSRNEATTFVISELEAIIGALPARVSGDASIVNSDAAHFLLAKLYLNKGVFDGSGTFAAADMTKVVQNVDAISGSLASSYWANFAPDNNTSNEILFSSKNIQGGDGGNMQSKWRMCNHYNQNPSGWNGFSTLAEYYNRFNTSDARAKYSSPSLIAATGNPVGFQVGQQYAPGGVTPLQDRNSHPLIFTPAITLITNGASLETAGIRGVKYIPDVANFDKPDNDLVLMRYSDALLMKVEAILRGGTGSSGTILADIAARAGVAAAPNTLDGVYAERGRELWWEGWRRNDMIRFGKFLDSRELKPYSSDAKYLLFPIPADALFNANLKQNPGY
ncbi:RagB/SusD family nutrient uptake outer membrane protein [Flavobacterium sp. SUN052]|uniref:RagB/SusD family nutrient uptake outer membrane protein n=1 Tax=Flavobacterium sp. SUN052 TaxID=3002441 RepID=UPI00237E31CF|nr:RagB/SusD family nutrient uptake outer membrane protein [Flavobacterium sp. SUN052]MEC4003216.1 RagB/SusD family nutrient uptake outer membrane protein [Flavobacterium sp. SUN052]